MKNLLISSAILLVVISCSKENFDKKEAQPFMSPTELKSALIIMPNLDSIARMNAGEFLESDLTKRGIDSIAKINSRVSSESSSSSVIDGQEYTDGSGKIHLKIFSKSTYPIKTNHPTKEVEVDADYVVVGGGAQAWGYQYDGGFLYESRPNDMLTSWIGSSKDHINPDPHYIDVYAIGMKIDSVTTDYLRSKIHLYFRTSYLANHPQIYATVPGNCLRLGGGVKVNWTGYGNLLTSSIPMDNNKWFVKSKDHRRPDPCTITAYAIGIENISYPNVGYIQVGTTWQAEPSYHGEGWVYTLTEPGWAQTCVGAQATWYVSGRMIVKMYPQLNYLSQALSLDHTWPDYGWTWAYMVMIRAAE
jgi:hypothetical protein